MNLNLACEVVRKISNNLLIKLFSEKQQFVARTLGVVAVDAVCASPVGAREKLREQDQQ